MPSPFPGMDPYLEHPGRWGDVHHEIISGARVLLARQIQPKYFVRIEERVYVADEGEPLRPTRVPDLHVAQRPGQEGRPLASTGGGGLAVAEPVVARTLVDDEAREARLEVVDRADRSIVAVIEVLSPTNKVPGSRGLASFEQKRWEVMNSPSHWVEIDLLRGGVSLAARAGVEPCEYLIHVSKVEQRPEGLLWPVRLAQPLPVVPIPLRGGDPDAPLDLQAVLATAYDRAGYDLDTDYRADPVPPLDPPWNAWADEWLRKHGMR